MKAFWFSADTNLPMHGLQRVKDVAQGPAAVGLTHVYMGDLKLMSEGLHWAEKLVTAIRFAGGPICWEVELGGKILTCGGDVHHPEQQHPDSMYTAWGCAEQRTYLKRTDFLPILLGALDHLCEMMAEGDVDHPAYIYTHCKQARSAQRVSMRWGLAQMALWECLRVLVHEGISWREVEKALQEAYKGEDHGA